jgi:hypothetical protein
MHHRHDTGTLTIDLSSRLPENRPFGHRKLRQAVSLPAQKRSETEVVVKTTEGRYVRRPAAKSFNTDAEFHITRNSSQLSRQVG